MAIKLFDLAARDPDIRFSPYCWRTKMALKHKGLEFQAVPWRFLDKDALSPSGQGRVPTIVDGERWIHDSWNIAVYLDQTYPEKPRLFQSERDQAMSRFVMQWSDLTLHLPISRNCLTDIHAILTPADQDYFRQSREQRFGMTLEAFVADKVAARAQLSAALGPLEQTLKTQRFLSGAIPGYGDYAVFGSLMWPNAVMQQSPLEQGTAVSAWFEAMLDLFDGFARKAKLARG